MNAILKQAKKYCYKALKKVANNRIFLQTIINNPFFVEELTKVKEEKQINKNNILIAKLQSCGQDIDIKGSIFISEPKSTAIGNNVHIGDNAYFSSAGGLTIGDNTHISRNVTIYTVNHNYQGKALPYDCTGVAKPVAIGKNVWIGMNVSIIPGVRIGDGAIIGMGTVVTQDIPPLAIVGNQHHRIIKYRDAEHYHNLETNCSYGGVNGQLIVSEKAKSFKQNKDNIFFVVTTGRSGSTTISSLLSQHSQITCLHEPRPQLIRLSTEFAHGEKSYQQTKDELYSIYCNSGIYPSGYYGESEQKLWNLIAILAELIPSSKFIWLIRDGRDVVASTYARAWFDSELENREGSSISSTKEILQRWMFYRLNGAKCGVFSHTEWQKMSVFERNCWYWSYVNSSIERQLQQLSDDRFFQVKIEDIQNQTADIQNFLGVESQLLQTPKLNIHKHHQNWYKKHDYWSNWQEQQKSSFIEYCGEAMDKWYPHWNDSEEIVGNLQLQQSIVCRK